MRPIILCVRGFMKVRPIYIGQSNCQIKTYSKLLCVQSELLRNRDDSRDLISNVGKTSPDSNELVDIGDAKEISQNDTSVIGPCNEDLSTYAPYFQPSFNFAAYVNKSPTLQEFVKLGVDLHMVERKEGAIELFLRLDFEKDVKQFIRFLHDIGVPSDDLGTVITKSPLILQEDLENLQVRINYLQSKRFTKDNIVRIVTNNPSWLLLSTENIDERLGYFQKTFKLSGNQVRLLAIKRPKLITYKRYLVKINTFSIKEEMGFSDDEVRTLLLKEPRLWTNANKNLVAVFNYAHNVMKLTHQQIVDFPQILKSREFRIKQRHLFLELLGRAQYNPKLAGYVSPRDIVSGTDIEFCQLVAKSSVESFNLFLKTL